METREKITGAEYARRLLGVNLLNQHLVDHLLEKLSPLNRDMLGWETSLLELKATYLPSPNFPDDPDFDQPQSFTWNVVHDFLALANAYGGCVVIGIDEDRQTKRLYAGDWDPNQILSRHGRGLEPQGTGKEWDHLKSDIEKHLLNRNGAAKARTFSFLQSNAKHPQAPRTEHTYELSAETMKRLSALVSFHPCHSEMCSCDVIAAIVTPVSKGDELLEVTHISRGVRENITFVRRDAHVDRLVSGVQIAQYMSTRDPASSDFYDSLRTSPGQMARQKHACSSIPHPGARFRGREDDLARLREICLSGRIALVHAPGGTGKTELVCKYAEVHAADYPGGMFLLPAEKTTSWRELLPRALEQAPSSDSESIQSWLGIEKASAPCPEGQPEASRRQTRESGYQDLLNAFNRTAGAKGTVLLLLDNVDTPVDFLADSLPDILRDGERFHILATSRSSTDVNEECTPRVDLHELAPLPKDEQSRLLLGGSPLPLADDEQSAAERILRELEGCTLYIARMARLVAENRRRGSVRPFGAALSRLLNSPLETTARSTGEKDDMRQRNALTLWTWTRDQLHAEEDGGRIAALAETIALFPPEGVARHVLEALWYAEFGRMASDDLLDAYRRDEGQAFGVALSTLCDYGLAQWDHETGIVRMHRLDQRAVRRSLSNPGWPRRIGEALRASPLFLSKDWVPLAKDGMLMAFCPWTELPVSAAVQIVSADFSYFGNVVNCDRFDFDDWWHILSAHPDHASQIVRHASFDPLVLIPPFVRNPVLRSFFRLEDLGGDAWSELLARDPSLADQCPWERLSKANWLFLLARKPEFRARCPHPEILYASHLGSFSTWALGQGSWGELLAEQPEIFADECQWTRLSTEDWVSVLSMAPEHHVHLPPPTWSKFTGNHWTRILKARSAHSQAFFEVYRSCGFPRKTSGGRDPGIDWADVLLANPQFKDACPYDRLSPFQWIRLLHADASYAERNPPWPEILSVRKGFFRHLVQEISGLAPKEFLTPGNARAASPKPSRREKLKEVGDRLERVASLRNLLDFQALGPSEDEAHIYGLHDSPSGDKSPSLEPLADYWRTFRRMPAPFVRLHPVSMPNYDLGDESQYEQFIGRLDQAIAAADSVAHAYGKAGNPGAVLAEAAQLSDLGWFFLICACPEFSSHCDWDIFSPSELCLLMLNRPSLWGCCKAEKFSGREWSSLLTVHADSKFVEACQWSKLSDDDWEMLLESRPWMARFRPGA